MLKKVVCFGEVLWDVLPSERIAGGAPMNVSIRLQSLGTPTQIISRTGNDEAGKKLLEIIGNKHVDTSLLQQDDDLPTGEVLVKLDPGGTASYDIVYPSAWDKIELTDENAAAVKNADAFVFGSLACRDDVSANTLFHLLEHARFKIFDVNLRAPFYSMPLVERLMNKADFIKLNEEELDEISKAAGSPAGDIYEKTKLLSEKTHTGAVCVTRGENGAVLFMNGSFITHRGYKVKVADTIGAGDGFLACLVNELFSGTVPVRALQLASAMGALVASRKGAVAAISKEEIENMVNKNKTT